jgi:quinol-cytochrome oxidoreductase complex cytochrome b subunit
LTSWYRRVRGWIDTRVGLTGTILKPGPQYTLNVFYWLGALLVTAFIFQGLTGLLMLLYYTPTVAQAYPSTAFIMSSVPMGRLLETVHLYSAYAMVVLAFMHMMRGYFVSVQKKPREFMWVVGMLMGLVVLGFGLTGYLLPWTVVSKSATDVTIGMLSFLPAQIGPTIKFLIAGTGSDTAELARFFDLHIVVLPAVMIGLLAIKLYMFEVHGAAEPAAGPTQKGRRLLPWFPDLFVYFSVMGAVFISIILGVSALFPLSLPPAFSPAAAASYVSQPEWYFLWIYQILKFSAFEGGAVVAALVAVTVGGAVMVLLPFFDRKRERDPAKRPFYTTLGIILVVELIVLAVWGYFTPGQVIPDSDAIAIVGGTGVAIAFMSLLAYRVRDRRMLEPKATASTLPGTGALVSFMGTPFRFPRLSFFFTLLLVVSSASLASTAELLTSQQPNPPLLVLSSLATIVTLFLMGSLVKRLAQAQQLPRNIQ